MIQEQFDTGVNNNAHSQCTVHSQDFGWLSVFFHPKDGGLKWGEVEMALRDKTNYFIGQKI